MLIQHQPDLPDLPTEVPSIEDEFAELLSGTAEVEPGSASVLDCALQRVRRKATEDLSGFQSASE